MISVEIGIWSQKWSQNLSQKLDHFLIFDSAFGIFDSGRRESLGIVKIKRKVYVGLSVGNRRELRSGVKN